MANVLGGSSAWSGPTGAEVTAGNVQGMTNAMSQFGSSAAQFANARSTELENRRNMFLKLAASNGMSPALMLSTPEGEQAARSILGDNFFGMIGPNKEAWESFFGMPMSEDDWQNFATLEYKKGNLTPPQAPGAPPKAGVTPPAPAPQQTVPGPPAPIVPPGAPEPSLASGQQVSVAGIPLEAKPATGYKAVYSPMMNGWILLNEQNQRVQPNQIPGAFGSSEEAFKNLNDAIGTNTLQRLDNKVFTIPADAKVVQHPTGNPPTGTFGPGRTDAHATGVTAPAATTPATPVAPDLNTKREFWTWMHKQGKTANPAGQEKSMDELIRVNQKDYTTFLQSRGTPQASEGSGAQTGVKPPLNLETAPVPTPEAKVAAMEATKAAGTTANEVSRTWKANPEIKNAGYQANLQTAARMLTTIDPGSGRIEDNPMMARAVLNFTEQGWRKVEADIEAVTMGTEIDKMRLWNELAAQSTMSAIAQSEAALKLLKPIQDNYDTRFGPAIKALADKGKTPAEISKLMAQDPEFLAADEFLKKMLSQVYGPNSAVVRTYITDPVTIWNSIFGTQPASIPGGFGVAIGAGGQAAVTPDQGDALVNSLYEELK